MIQSDGFGSLSTVVVALFTSMLTEAPAVRPRFAPDTTNGLRQPSDLMVDILVTVRRDQVGGTIGRLDGDELARADRAILTLLRFAE